MIYCAAGETRQEQSPKSDSANPAVVVWHAVAVAAGKPADETMCGVRYAPNQLHRDLDWEDVHGTNRCLWCHDAINTFGRGSGRR